jgi:hypothetical protein
LRSRFFFSVIPGLVLAHHPGMTTQIGLPVVPMCRIPSGLPEHPNQWLSFLRPALTRGAFRDRHERWARDAMDATHRSAIFARTSDVFADGEVVWSWRPDAGAKFRNDDCEATVAKEPGHRGERV